MSKSNVRKAFVHGVFFLTLSNILTKLCGLFLKIPLTNTLGDTGMAYFNLAYAVYKWFYMISTAGLPVAAAVITARYAENDDMTVRADNLLRVRNVTLCAFFVLGSVGSVCMWFGAPLFASLQKVNDAAPSIAAIAPALFFICIASALRGWYQGLGSLMPASIAQALEALVKMVCGLWFGAYAIERGFPMYVVAAYAIAGLSVGCFLGMLVYLISLPVIQKREGIPIRFRRKSGDAKDTVSHKSLLSALLRIALPVTISASVLSFCDMLDSMIVIRRLCGTGMSDLEALQLYGNYTALAVPMFNLPPILIYPVTTALIPVITAASANKKDTARRDRIIRGSLSAAAYIALPCTAGMSVMAKPLLNLFFREDLAATGAPMLRILAIAILFLSLLAMTNAILQAMECARYPVYSICAGAVVKLVSSWILTGNPEIGILGTPISTVLCYLTMAVCNLIFVVRAADLSLPFMKMMVKPAICAVLCAIAANAVYTLFCDQLPETVVTIGAVLTGALIYCASMFAVRGADREVLDLFLHRKRRA